MYVSPVCLGDVIGVGLAEDYNNYITGRNLLSSPDYNAFNALFSFAMNFYSLKTRRSLSTISNDQTQAIIQSLNSGIITAAVSYSLTTRTPICTGQA